MLIYASQCPKCKDIVYSRARHDMRYCSCESIAVDGGFDYCKVSFKPLIGRPIPTKIRTPKGIGKKQLFADWCDKKDKYGLIKHPNSKSISKALKLIEAFNIAKNMSVIDKEAINNKILKIMEEDYGLKETRPESKRTSKVVSVVKRLVERIRESGRKLLQINSRDRKEVHRDVKKSNRK